MDEFERFVREDIYSIMWKKADNKCSWTGMKKKPLSEKK